MLTVVAIVIKISFFKTSFINLMAGERNMAHTDSYVVGLGLLIELSQL